VDRELDLSAPSTSRWPSAAPARARLLSPAGAAGSLSIALLLRLYCATPETGFEAEESWSAQRKPSTGTRRLLAE
jgi:hypothetical protein